MEELKKQLAEERERDELMRQAQEGGHIQASSKLDWMYMGGMQGQAAAAQRENAQDKKVT